MCTHSSCTHTFMVMPMPNQLSLGASKSACNYIGNMLSGSWLFYFKCSIQSSILNQM